MDPMETCRAHNIPPFNCVVIFGYTVPAPLPDDWRDATKKLIKDVFSDFELYLGYDPAGKPYQQLLLMFSDAQKCQVNLAVLKDDKCVIDGKSYKVTRVDSTSIHGRPKSPTASRSTSFLRRIRNFSGATKPGPGEIDIHEWMMLAYEIEENGNFSPEDKLRWLKNSLVKAAYTLISASKVSTCAQLIDVIAMTFGGSKSPDHIISQIHQAKQHDGESPSLFLVRLQEMMMELARTAPTFLEDPEKFRINQFLHGLKPADYDLIDLRLQLSQIQDHHPTFPNLLSQVQRLERNRRERNERTGKTVHASSLLAQLKLEHESCQTPEDSAEDSAVIRELKVTNQKLTQLLHSSAAKPKLQPKVAEVTVSALEAAASDKKTSQNKRFQKQKPKPQKREVFCWNCGELGHTVFSCTQEWDGEKVREKVQAFKLKKAEKTSVTPPEN